MSTAKARFRNCVHAVGARGVLLDVQFSASPLDICMTATILDGHAMARALKNDIAGKVRKRLENGLTPPDLAVLLVGDDPGSEIYVMPRWSAPQIMWDGLSALNCCLPAVT